MNSAVSRSSWMRRPADSKGMPMPSYSLTSQPAPRPISSRPSDSTSMDAISLVSTVGRW